MDTAIEFSCVKVPPTTILPSEKEVIDFTSALNPVPTLKVLSMVPSEFRRTILPTGTPLNAVKVPPTKIFPSGVE